MRKILLVSLLSVCVGCEEPPPIVFEAAATECEAPAEVRLLEATEVLLRERIGELEARELDAIYAGNGITAPKPTKGRKDPDNVWTRTRAQGVQLARMFASEDSAAIRRKAGGGTGGELTLDHRLMAQTVYNLRSARKSFRGWIDVMSFLSPHVGRTKDLVPGTRQRWTSQLPATGNRNTGPGPGWVDCMAFGEATFDDCDGDWRIHGPYWVALREATIDLWLTADFEAIARSVKKKPIKWGNAEDAERFLKNNPNSLCVLDTDTKNFFFAHPGEGCELGDSATEAAREGMHFRDGP